MRKKLERSFSSAFLINFPLWNFALSHTMQIRFPGYFLHTSFNTLIISCWFCHGTGKRSGFPVVRLRNPKKLCASDSL